jgi:hypothetical protein
MPASMKRRRNSLTGKEEFVLVLIEVIGIALP